ncbi:MAG: hypothetical protein MI922_09915, partial [Bacteroidales bacterium]|nr:hypothetical protein [Bacteroidales bacterium]
MEVSKGSINSTKGANYHLFDSLEDRDNLPQHQRMIGIKCYVINENKEYQLINGIENSNWQLTTGDTSDSLSISTSKVIYVDATGNDLTGDGTQTLPYQTLERGLLDLKGFRINDGVTVTIQLGFGSFQFTDNCKEIIETIRFQSTEATLFIQGSYSELSDVALSPTSDPFVYEASISGTSPNWTNDEFKFSFFQTGTNLNSHLFPISSNTSNTIETFPDLASGSIIKLETSLDMMGNKFALDFMNPHIKTTIRTYSMAISLINLANMPSHFELNSR